MVAAPINQASSFLPSNSCRLRQHQQHSRRTHQRWLMSVISIRNWEARGEYRLNGWHLHGQHQPLRLRIRPRSMAVVEATRRPIEPLTGIKLADSADREPAIRSIRSDEFARMHRAPSNCGGWDNDCSSTFSALQAAQQQLTVTSWLLIHRRHS